MTPRSWFVFAIVATLSAAAGCGNQRGTENASRPADAARTPASAASPPPDATRAAAGPIDMCGIVTASDAKEVLGPLPMQPPAKTDNAGFGVYLCMYVGPVISGQGAQTVFSRLTVQAGSGKDAPDLLQADAEKRKAAVDFPSVGDAAKRNDAGSFVWARQSGVSCTAEISNGLPAGLTPDIAASRLATLCRKVFSAVKKT